MFRFVTVMLLALALSIPVVAAAEEASEQETQIAAVSAAQEVQLDASPSGVTNELAEGAESRPKATRKLVPRGSNQSAAGYRFETPYAFPEQSLPILFPQISTFSF